MTTSIARRRIGRAAVNDQAEESVANTGTDSPVAGAAHLIDALRVPIEGRASLLASEWVTTVQLRLPAAGWKLHPRSISYVRSVLDGRCPLVSRNQDVMVVSYLTAAGTAEDLALAHATSRYIAQTVGIGVDAVASVELTQSSPTEERPGLSIVE